MATYGYARVSKKEQNIDRQVDAFIEYGIDRNNIFEERFTGTKKQRPELTKLMDVLQEGDLVVFADLTRVSRSTVDLLMLVDELGKKGVDVKSLKESWLDTTTPQGRFMLTITAGVSQLERDLISQRTSEGLEAAKKRGKHGGRPKKNGDNMKYAVELFRTTNMSIAEICRNTNISRPTLYRRLKELGLK
ncbi:recombinase family protein [Alkalicoccobacillus gibsonii]|uniref:recombinase family protein n=1 Tax=Alkalicoccobacillus gibsonii TaxID=79881 RepID=UPI0035178995